MVPHEATKAVVEEAELRPAMAYAERHRWRLTWLPENLTLLADGSHPDSSPVRLHADLAGYRAIPPAWTFTAPGSTVPRECRFPAAGALPGGTGSIFHGKRLICAPFNRIAYSDHGGPHSDWKGPSLWLNVRGVVRATTLAEMLAVIICHLRYSPGWLP